MPNVAKLLAVYLDWVHYSQAEALKGLSSLGVADHWIEAEKLYTSLQNSKEVGFNSHVALAQLKVEQALYQEADKILSDTAKNKQWQVKAELHSKRLVLNLETFNRDGVAETAQEALKKASEESDKNERVGLLFTAALGKLLTRGEDWEQTARKFITETDHDYVPYIAMMLYARLAGQEQDEAKGVLEERWSKADPSHWEERLRAGEETAWREMLIGYCLGHVKRDEIFGPLESNDAFSKSALQSVPLGRSGMLCEAYFYGALLAQAQGNKTEMEKDLRQVLATNRRSYYEYAMAKFLLWQESNSSKQAKATLARSVFGAP